MAASHARRTTNRSRRVVAALAWAALGWAELAGCAGDPPRAERSDAPAGAGTPPARSAPPSSTAIPGCPGREFATFLALFSEQPAVQWRFTRYPLDYRWVEDSGRGQEFMRRAMPADSIRGRDTLYLSDARRARDSLQVHVDSADAGRRVVTLFKPDTDYQLEYTFERRADGCWELTRYDNQSL